MEILHYSVISSPIGPLVVGASARGLVCLEFGRTPAARHGVHWVESATEVEAYTREVDEYFSGKRREFTMPLDLRGTDFQKRCWQALLSIPYGETRSYADIAKAVGRPKAVRAVGGANHRNPVAIVVPCHRVIASNGTLCGYGGGLSTKEWLLKLERGQPAT